MTNIGEAGSLSTIEPKIEKTVGLTGLRAGIEPAAMINDPWAALAGLRFVLAFVVVCHHLAGFSPGFLFPCPIGLFGGFAAVLGFFMISGYSMAHSLTTDPNRLTFYERRFRRIYPLYVWGIFLPALLTAGALLLWRHGFTPAQSTGFTDYVVALVFGNGIVRPQFVANGVLWSLCVEVLLYAASPFLLRCSYRTLVIIAAASAVCFVAHNLFTNQEYYAEMYGASTFCLAWAFVAGFAFYRFRDKLPPTPILATIAAGMVFAYPEMLKEPLSPLTVGGCVLIIRSLDKIKITAAAASRLHWLGNISFCLYVVHAPVMAAAAGLHNSSALAITAACLAAAVASYYLVDLPTRKLVKYTGLRTARS